MPSKRLADHHLRPYPTLRSYHYPQTALGASSTPTYPYLSH